MNFDELKSRDVKDLRLLAGQYGIRVGGRAKAETIAKLIVEFVANKPKDALKHVAEAQKAPMHINTEDEVRIVLKTVLEKPGFTVQFLEDNTWIFKCRGAEESGHMSVPLRVIRSKAEGVSRGASNPRGLRDHQTNSTFNSGTILMV